MKERKFPLLIFLFNLVYLSYAIYLCQKRSNTEFIIYIGVVAIVMALMLFFYNRFALSKTLLWLMSLWGLAHMSGGLINVPQGWPTAGETPVLYNWWLIEERFKFDQLVHAYGFGLCTWLLWDILKGSIAKRSSQKLDSIVPSYGLLFLCALGAMGLGALNEVIEFMVMLTVPETNVGGYENTGWDLFANMVGALLVSFFLYIGGKK